MRFRLAALALASAVFMAGCSSSEDTVRDAVDETTDEGSAHVVITGDTEGAGQSFTVTGEGDFDYANLRGRGRFDFSELPTPAGVELGTEGVGEIIFDGSIYYMDLPILAQISPELEGWVKFDTEALAESSGQLGQLGQNDPSQVISYLNGATEIEEAGEETIDGVETTRYDLTIDYRRAQEEAPEELKPAFDTIVEELEIETSPGGVWIDGQGLVRRMFYEWTFEPEVEGADVGETTQRVELEFSDFGQTVEIEIPPDDEVTDFDELLGNGS